MLRDNERLCAADRTLSWGAGAILVMASVLLLPISAAAATPDEAAAIAFDYLGAHRAELGLSEGDLDEAEVANSYLSRPTRASYVYLQQKVGGIDVYNAILSMAVSQQGNVAHVANRFIGDAASAIDSGSASLSAIEAVERAAEALELGTPEGLRVLESSLGADQRVVLSEGGIASQPIPARLVYQPMAKNRLRLAWDLEIDAAANDHWWSVRIDAATGQLLHKTDYVDFEQYEVYPTPIESPNHTTPVPPADARTIVVDPFLDGAGSPFGWHDTDGSAGAEFTITRGNNVHAYLDANADNAPDGGASAEPDGGAGLDFTGATVPLDLGQAPSTYRQAAIANLFYWNNIIHDVMWEYGFDEAGGNFQVNNYGNGGLGNDDVRAEAQDGSGTCNANFGTPSDGSRPRMQMFLCGNRDGDFDNGVIVHEYGHGISNRLTGGPGASGCLGNTEQMGEGWSDYYGLMFTMEPGDAATDARGIGTYLFGQPADGPGIRPAPYSTDTSVNNFTYSGISGVSVPHGVGFVWATMLWDMTWALIDEYGFSADLYDADGGAGNQLAMQLVTEGMKLQPCGPGFVDGRDAILAADDLLTGDGSPNSGVNQCLIWQAFADRGLGFSADQGSPNSVGDGSEAFDLPPFCDTVGASPDEVNICQGDDADFLIGVGAAFTAPPVTMTTAGEPGGSSVGFSVNPVPAPLPSTTTMTVSNTGAVPAGSYTITVTGTDTTPTANAADVMLNVFDAVPAGPGLVSPADTAIDVGTQPTFTWNALGNALTYTLEVDDDAAFGSIDYSATGIEGTSHTPTSELDFTSTYYWRVRGVNSCGDGVDSSVFSFSTVIFPGDCLPGAAAQMIFEDDLEGNTSDWTSSGTGDTWAGSSARVTSGTNAFYAMDPETLSDQRLVSPPITLAAGLTQPTLQFQNYQLFETPNTDGRCWDAGILEVTTDGGTTWAQVPAGAMLTDEYDDVIWNDTPGNNPITNDYGATEAWCDPDQPFEAAVVDISAYVGNTVQFRWRLGSDSAAGGEGWYIDDVKVQSCVSGDIFSDGFESGDTSVWSQTNP